MTVRGEFGSGVRRTDRKTSVKDAAPQQSTPKGVDWDGLNSASLKIALESARGAMWELDVPSGQMRHGEFFYHLLGIEPQVGMHDGSLWAERLHPQDFGRVTASMRDAIEGGSELYEAEYRVRHADGSWRWVLDRGRASARTPAGRARKLVGFLVDVTERVLTQEALRQSEFRYRTVASMTPGYVFEYRFLANGDAEAVWISEGLQNIYGCSVEEHSRLGGCIAFLEPEYEPLIRAFRRRLAAGMAQGGDVRVHTIDGTRKWVHMSAVPLRDPHSGAVVGYIGAGYDITQRKLAEQDRQSLEREIIEIANREQQRIGNDLHDGLGQDLTGIALMLRGINAQLHKEHSSACLDVEDVISLVNGAIENTRALARGLSPVSAERDGLIGALQALAARATERFRLPVAFHARLGTPLTLDEAAATHLYRIAQEALTNIVRHSRATEACIVLETSASSVKLTVADNGRGFRGAALEGRDGLGLRIMRYRAQTLGGDIVMENDGVAGAVVCCSCPLPASEPISEPDPSSVAVENAAAEAMP
jgi:PAS domain S-box-containing protein